VFAFTVHDRTSEIGSIVEHESKRLGIVSPSASTELKVNDPPQ